MSTTEGQDLRRIFEFELKRKLAMRAKSSTHEMFLLMSSFRFYDINNMGTINKDQWCKAFMKIGLNGFSEKDLSFLFDVYDLNGTGRINYKNFTNFLYEQGSIESISVNDQNITQQNTSQNEIPETQITESIKTKTPINIPSSQIHQNIDNSSFKCPTPSKLNFKQRFKLLLDYIKNSVNDSSGLTYYSLALKLKTNEDILTRLINYENLLKSFRDIDISLDPNALNEFFCLMDVSDEGMISTLEFLRILRGNLSEKRKMLIVEKFSKIDIDRKGFCPVDLLRQLYNPNKHPDVLLGKIKPEEAYKEFCFMLDVYVQNIKRGNSNIISFEEFIEFYHAISAGTINDMYFEDLLNGVWNFGQSDIANRNQFSKDNINGEQSMVINNEPQINTNLNNTDDINDNPQSLFPQSRRRTPINSNLQKRIQMNDNMQRRTPKNDIMQMDIPINNIERDIPKNNNIQRRTPINNMERRTPLNGMQRNTPMNNMERGIPMNDNMQMEMPMNNMERDIPMNNSMERRTPINNNMQRRTPINNNMERRPPMNNNQMGQIDNNMNIRQEQMMDQNNLNEKKFNNLREIDNQKNNNPINYFQNNNLQYSKTQDQIISNQTNSLPNQNSSSINQRVGRYSQRNQVRYNPINNTYIFPETVSKNN